MHPTPTTRRELKRAGWSPVDVIRLPGLILHRTVRAEPDQFVQFGFISKSAACFSNQMH